MDIETSGLDSTRCQILSIGAIIEDTKKKLDFETIPKFNVIVLQHEITGSPRALTMNKGIIELMGEYLEGDKDIRKKHDEHSGYQFLNQEDVAKVFFGFLVDNGFGTTEYYENPRIDSKTKPILLDVAGKNFGTFDKLFLDQLPWWQKLIRVKQRIIDPSVLFCDWKEDESLPSLTECKKRANIKGVVTHNALEDAWDVILLLRKFY
jgi:oligoribonuclease